MSPSPWIIPLIVAFIAAVPGIMGAVAMRRSSRETAETTKANLAVTGLVALVTELQEERLDCRVQLQGLREELRAVEAEVDQLRLHVAELGGDPWQSRRPMKK